MKLTREFKRKCIPTKTECSCFLTFLVVRDARETPLWPPRRQLASLPAFGDGCSDAGDNREVEEESCRVTHLRHLERRGAPGWEHHADIERVLRSAAVMSPSRTLSSRHSVYIRILVQNSSFDKQSIAS